MKTAPKTETIVRNFALYDDEDSFRLFFNIYYPKLVKFAYYILESHANAEDVVSSAFVKLWNQRKKLLEVRKIDSYLFMSIKNQCYNYLRDNKQHFLKNIDDLDYNFIVDLQNPEQVYLNQEIKDKVIFAINDLPPRCKLVFNLIREEGMKYKEVAELLEISNKTVEAQMTRAISKIKETLAPYLNDQGLGADDIRIAKS
ncbi:MAG: RNA polymerase sigma-70 factor [Cyclobacteriaceae bacterium]